MLIEVYTETLFKVPPYKIHRFLIGGFFVPSAQWEISVMNF